MILPVVPSVAVAVLLLFAATQAKAKAVLTPEGGPGGSGFRLDCPSGQFLVGVSLRAGSWVDAIAPLCAPFNMQTGRFDRWKRGKFAGGRGGQALLKDAACPADFWVTGIRFGWTRSGNGSGAEFIDYVQMICFPFASGPSRDPCAHTGDGCWSKHPNPPPKGLPLPGSGLQVIGDQPFAQFCPRDDAATGIHGRAGAYVDALGLSCDQRPKRMVAESTPAQPPAKPQAPDPSAPPVEVGNASIPRASFSGVWNTVAGKDAQKLRLEMTQQGTLVKGSYQPNDGRLSGRINGNVLIFNWAGLGMSGTGKFEMLDPQNSSFRGEFSIDGQPGIAGYWGGTRQ